LVAENGHSLMRFLLRQFQSLLASKKSEAEVSQAIIRSSTLNSIPQLLVWGAFYWYYGVQEPALVLFAWAGIAVVLTVAYFLLPTSLPVLLPLQFAGVLGFNAAATYLLGGLVQSYGQFLWGLLVPMGALVVYGPRQATYWFLAYFGILIALVPLSSQAQPLLPETIGQLMTALNMFITGTFIFLGFCYFKSRKDHFYDLLQREEEKSERLLLNILPAEIARVLKDEQGIIAALYENASVLFFDLVGLLAWLNGWDQTRRSKC
jgi:guanylate cyclase